MYRTSPLYEKDSILGSDRRSFGKALFIVAVVAVLYLCFDYNIRIIIKVGPHSSICIQIVSASSFSFSIPLHLYLQPKQLLGQNLLS